jgi:mxaK protein
MTRRDFVAWLLLAAAAGVAGQGAWQMWDMWRGNAAMASLAAGKDVAVPPDADGSLLAARGAFLIAHHRENEAQAIADRMAAGGDQAARAALLYTLGNAMLRRALAGYLTKPIRLTAPLIQLAKAEYREALAIDPGNWDARYNLDIASALVHETGSSEPNVGQDMARERAFRPDIPGAPDGLP